MEAPAVRTSAVRSSKHIKPTIIINPPSSSTQHHHQSTVIINLLDALEKDAVLKLFFASTADLR
jgi:hypothetical protein